MERVFLAEGKQKALDKIKPPDANIFFARQQEMKGTGHALLLARPFTGSSPFIVAYPDDIVFARKSLSLQLVEAHRQTGHAMLAVKNLEGADVSRYGVVDPGGDGNPRLVRRLVEKPAPGSEPSKLVSYGRYLFTANIFPYLEQGFAKHRGGEYYHIDALNRLAADGLVSALDFEGERLDTGEPMGYLEAICRYALQREDLSDAARRLFGALSR